ncbi:MAG: TIGR03936 family radical SAM-associated protein [Dehalococcoidia bacterium]
MKAQRLRFRYRVTSEALGLGQRDLVRAWEDALAAAGLPLARSEGKRSAAMIALAAPLPQGVTSDCEYADVFLGEMVDPRTVLGRVTPGMPPGIDVTAVEEVGIKGSSLQAQLRWADYEVRVPSNGLTASDIESRIAALLEARTLPAEHRREKGIRQYDLRAMVLDVRLEAVEDGAFRLAMRLRAEQDNTARADQTVLALGLPEALTIHRRELHLDDSSAAVRAFRAAGERER